MGTVVDEVRLNIVVEVQPLQSRAFLAQFLIAEQLLVGRLGGIDASRLHAFGILAEDDPDEPRRVAMQGIVVGRAHDARLIKTVETVDDDTFKVGGQIWHTLGKVGTELANRLALYLIVVVEIRLEHAQQGVSLLLQGLIGLIDREIVFCDDRAIMPMIVP